jgi:hypothetical protein
MKVLASPKSLLPRFEVTLEFVSGVSLCEVFFFLGGAWASLPRALDCVIDRRWLCYPLLCDEDLSLCYLSGFCRYDIILKEYVFGHSIYTSPVRWYSNIAL